MLRIFNRYYPLRNIAFFFIEGFIIFASVVTAAFVRFGGDINLLLTYELIVPKALLVTLVCQTCLYYNELYDFKITNSNLELGIRMLQAVGSSYLILALIYFLFPAIILGRGIFLINLFCILCISNLKEWLTFLFNFHFILDYIITYKLVYVFKKLIQNYRKPIVFSTFAILVLAFLRIRFFSIKF